MASLIGVALMLLAAGATLAAVMQPLMEIWQIIVKYIRGIYDRQSTRTDSNKR
jgi:hypothetical protein